MVGIQSKLNHCQQSQSDAVNVDDDSYLLGIIQSFDLDSTNVEGHEHCHQLKETLVGIRDGQPYNSAGTDTSVYKIVCSACNKHCQQTDQCGWFELTVIEVGC